ncbi:MAG: ABC transporter ATP-binding protein [Candidatus Aenigmatarchaeota archaeon]
MLELLKISNLKVYFETDEGEVKAVDGIDLEINEGETLGLVGESGCGKTTTGLSIIKLLPQNSKVSGKILFLNEDLLSKNEEEMNQIRGNKISMIFQNPNTSLNPLMSVGFQIAEVLMFHKNMSKKDAYKEATKLLKIVGMPDPEKTLKKYPHELSGGMKQRVVIAMALACKPKLVIADEPTTAVDVTIQAQILELMKELQREFNISILLISHDFGVIAEMCDKVAVMYAGKIVEKGSIKQIFKNPKHPYTIGLLKALPKRNVDWLATIPGIVPSLINPPKGCRFSNRCEYVMDKCIKNNPELLEIEEGHLVACYLINMK